MCQEHPATMSINQQHLDFKQQGANNQQHPSSGHNQQHPAATTTTTTTTAHRRRVVSMTQCSVQGKKFHQLHSMSARALHQQAMCETRCLLQAQEQQTPVQSGTQQQQQQPLFVSHVPLANMELHNHNEQRHEASNAHLEYQPARVVESRLKGDDCAYFISSAQSEEEYLSSQAQAQAPEQTTVAYWQQVCHEPTNRAEQQQQPLLPATLGVEEAAGAWTPLAECAPIGYATAASNSECYALPAPYRQQQQQPTADSCEFECGHRPRVNSTGSNLPRASAGACCAATTSLLGVPCELRQQQQHHGCSDGPSFPISRSMSLSLSSPAAQNRPATFEACQQALVQQATIQASPHMQQQQHQFAVYREPAVPSSLSSNCSSVGSPAGCSLHSFNVSPRSTPTTSPQPFVTSTAPVTTSSASSASGGNAAPAAPSSLAGSHPCESTKSAAASGCINQSQLQQQQQQQQQQKHHHHHQLHNDSGLGINLEQYISKRNERERSRVRNVNDAFDNLKNSLPLDIERLTKRMSKVEILRTAIGYIRNLEDLLGNKEHSNQNLQQSQRPTSGGKASKRRDSYSDYSPPVKRRDSNDYHWHFHQLAQLSSVYTGQEQQQQQQQQQQLLHQSGKGSLSSGPSNVNRYLADLDNGRNGTSALGAHQQQ